ncbi:hypothetical protein GA0115243_10818 [Streptomyces sp. ScaeMP-e83]|nr:hypothetical protein GA0115243_10818 [Streptomyces sp. ScaeMP-e83]
MTTPTVRLTEDVPQRGVRRTGATLLHPDRGLRVIDEHLRVRLSAPHPMPLLADVLVAEFPSLGLPPNEDPVRYAAELADCHPGALVVAVYRGPRCWLRLGGRARALVREPEWPTHPWAVWASVAHVWLVAGLDPDALDPAPVRIVRTVRGYAPASPRPSSEAAVPEGSGPGAGASAPAGSRAPSRARASSASAERDRPTEEYRDSASR